MADTPREFLETKVKPLLPSGWKWEPTERNLDALDRTTVAWKQREVTRLPEAPIGHVKVSGLLVIISPKQDFALAEIDLDDHVSDLCSALDAVPGVVWEKATKVTTENDTYLGYELNLWLISCNDTSPEI